MSSRTMLVLAAVVGGGVFGLSSSPVLSANADAGTGPQLKSSGPLTFGPDGILFVADTQGAAIYALEMVDRLVGGQAGTKDITGIDEQIAARLGNDAREIQINDLAVNPASRNAFISISRGRGVNAAAVLLRVDGAGSIDVLRLDDVKYTRLTLPNPPDTNPEARRNPRTQAITDLTYVDGRLFIAGLSNEEFSSKLRSVAFPFNTIDEGASVEIWHAAHGQFETHSPVYTFVPFDIEGERHLIAGYLCTPLVKFPIGDLSPGSKVMGTPIAELGNRNRPLGMIVYK